VRIVLTLGLLLVVSTAIGCGDSKPKHYPVSGTVTLDSKPLAEGFIYFKDPQVGAIDSFEIKDGQFKGEALAGNRRVEVTSYSAKGKMVDVAGVKQEVRQNLIPNRYSLESTLTADVTPEGPNQFTFDLVTK
jgi:hypothetical protein